MAVNLLEDRLIYHDKDGDTLKVQCDNYQQLIFEICAAEGVCNVDRDAVETLRDSLTCWLKTGSLLL